MILVRKIRFCFLSLIAVWVSFPTHAAEKFAVQPDVIVDASGCGDCTSIQDALDSVAMFPYQRTVILIRNGVYQEKIRITKNYVTLLGESRDSTRIEYAQLRTDWEANRDFYGPGVVNIDADDIIIQNLTIRNTQPEIGPHAFAIYGYGTRVVLDKCTITSKGGDTVSLWNYKTGLYYHCNCHFEGAVDFVCPRGWCFIRDSEFYEVKKTASVWHAGHFAEGQKLVIVNSSFDGVPGFQLGRHHYDAQFLFMNCLFSGNMADTPVYLNSYEDATRNNPIQWGDRVYFYQCRQKGNSYPWISDCLPSNVTADSIDAAWTFNGVWNPENTQPLQVTTSKTEGNVLTLYFSEPVTVKGNPALICSQGGKFEIVKRRFLDINELDFYWEADFPIPVSGIYTLIDGAIIASNAYVEQRSLGPFEL